MSTLPVILRTITIIISLTLCCLVSCAGPTTAPVQSAPPPATTVTYTPPPTTTPPPDTPKISLEEMSLIIWGKLPNDLPPSFQKTQFQSSSGNASYAGNGKWQYQNTGQVRLTDLLPLKTYEKSPDYWVEERSQQVLTRNLLLKADYFENSGTLNLQPVQVVSENTSIEILSQTAVVAQRLKVNYISATTTGYDVRFEGSATNTGAIALQNVVFEATFYDFSRNPVNTGNTTLTPSKIEVGQTITFFFILSVGNLKRGPDGSLGTYDYRFLTSTGKTITLQK